jgi:hypothetical protein
VLTMTSQEIDYVAASFAAWCAANGRSSPDVTAALAYFNQVQHHEPYAAELIDADWDDFIAFLRERRLIVE